MDNYDEYFYDAIDLLKQMIAIPSRSRNENAVANLIEQRMTDWGLNPRRFGNNLLLEDTEYDTNRHTILLNSHIDTVPPAEGWETDPFTPIETDDKIIGLGSNDAGASVVSLLAAWRIMKERARSYNLLYLASCEEEVSGKNGLESVIPQLPKIDVAIVGEPTGMNPAIAERGLMVFDGEIHGVAGHAARDEGVNAIYKALDVVATLRDFKFERISPTLGPIKISVTQIEAGHAHNIVPDLAKIVVDVRTTEVYSHEEIVEQLQRAVPECTLTPRSTRLRASGISADHPIVQRAMMLGLKPFGSPTLSDQALMPWPSVKMGPGDSARSHTANEFIRTSEIRQAIETYTTILTSLTL